MGRHQALGTGPHCWAGVPEKTLPLPPTRGPGRVLVEGHNTLHQRIIKAKCLPGEPAGSESLSSGSLG